MIGKSLQAIQNFFSSPSENELKTLLMNVDPLVNHSTRESIPNQERYFAYEVARSIFGLKRLCEGYQIDARSLNTQPSFQSLMTNERRSELQSVLHKNCCSPARFIEQRKGSVSNVILAASSSAMKEALGAMTPHHELATYSPFRRSTDASLDPDQLLALTDYVHPHTGVFESVVQASRLDQIGFPDMLRGINFISKPLELAIQSLADDPRFAVNTPPGNTAKLYKALKLTQPGAVDFTLKSLRNSLVHNAPYMLSKITSASAHESASYINRPEYDCLLEIEVEKAANVLDFQHEECKDEVEAIIPPHPKGFQVVSIASDEIDSMEAGAKPITRVQLRAT